VSSSDPDTKTPVDPQLVPVLEAVRRRGRWLRLRRRLFLGGAVGVAAALVAVISLMATAGSSRQHRVIVETSPATTVATPTPMPKTFVGATPAPATGVPGVIQVASTADGRVLARLASTYTLYTQNGLARSPDGAIIYFDRLLPIGRGEVEISAVSAAGGPVTNVAQGIDPVVSPDGRYLAYEPASSDLEPVAITNLTTGATRTIDLYKLLAGYAIQFGKGVSWLSDNDQLAVIADKVGGATECPAVVPCPTTAVSFSARLIVLDLNTPNPAATAMTVDSPPGQTWTFVAGGPSPGSAVIFKESSPTSSAASELTEIDFSAPGHPQRNVASAPGVTQPVSVDASVTHLLYLDGTTLNTATISNGKLANIHSLPGAYAIASW